MNEAIATRGSVAGHPVVLVVDDEPDLLELVTLTLGRMSLRTRTASDLESARRLLRAECVVRSCELDTGPCSRSRSSVKVTYSGASL